MGMTTSSHHLCPIPIAERSGGFIPRDAFDSTSPINAVY